MQIAANKEILKKPYSVLWIVLIAFLILAFIINRFGLSIKNNPCYVAQVVEDKLDPILFSMDERIGGFAYDSYDFRRIQEDLEVTDDFNLFYYEDQNLKYWTDFKTIIPYHKLPREERFIYFDYKGNKFIIKKKKLDLRREVFAVLQLYQQFPFENQYLESGFNEHVFPGQNFELYHSKKENQVNYNGEYLFSIHGTESKEWVPAYINWLTVSLYGISILIIVVLLIYYAVRFALKGYFFLGFLLLTFGLTTIRYVMIVREFPFNVIHISVFDPVNYTDGFLNPSLGDLLLNLLFALTTILYVQFGLKYSTFLKKFLVRKSVFLWVPVVSAVTFLTLVSFRLIYDNVRNILSNSQIELDIVSSISFNELRITALVIYFVTGLIFFFKWTFYTPIMRHVYRLPIAIVKYRFSCTRKISF